MIRHQYKEWEIEVIDESTHTFGSADNNYTYSKHYFGKDAEEYPTSKHGVKILHYREPFNDCIVIGSGGATGIHHNSNLINGDELLICCCDTLFCLSIPDLDLKWKTRADLVTCFQLFKLKEDYIVHGELQITRIDSEGNIKWVFGGSDIFVSIEGKEEFKLEKDCIILMDFGNSTYKLDFDGNLISKNI